MDSREGSELDLNARTLLDMKADARKMNKFIPATLLVAHGASLLFLYQGLASQALPADKLVVGLGWWFIAGASAAFMALVQEWNVLHGEAAWIRAHLEGEQFSKQDGDELNAAIFLWRLCVSASAVTLFWGVSAPIRDTRILTLIAS